MPKPGHIWRHVTFGTYGSWLPGDPRGWRSRNHKQHSSGDYKQRPKPGEHQGLYNQAQALSQTMVTLDGSLRENLGLYIVQAAREQNIQLLALAICSHHVHLLAELPEQRAEARRIVGRWKQASSKAIRSKLPGRIWAKAGDYKPIRDVEHQRRTFHYILKHRDEGAWVWSYQDEMV